MKKVFPVMVLLLFATSFVSAYYGGDLGSNLGYGMNQLINVGEQMFGPLFSAFLGGTGEHMFERILFLCILISIIYMVVSNMDIFKSNPTVVWIITISISLLSTRFLVGTLVETVLLPYSVLGVSLTAVLPILIYFTFVQSFSESAIVRKVLWIFFIIIFLGIWGARYDELGKLSWIYMITAIVAFLFLLFDGTIRKVIRNQKMKELDEDSRQRSLINMRKELDELEENKTKGRVVPEYYKKMKKELIKQIKKNR